MIVITTPSGDIGGRVLARVLEAGIDVRIVARHPAKVPSDIRDRTEIVEGSHADGAVIRRAMDGASAVFWLPPGDPTALDAHAAYVGFSRAFIESLPGSSVSHVVGVSAVGRGWPKPAGLVTASLAMDDLIGATGVSYRALCCASLMDNVLRQVGPIRSEGVFYAPTPRDLPLPHVAKEDVAEVGTGLLLDLEWNGVEEVPLLGPDDISHNAMAAIMSEVLGKPVRYQEMSMDQFEVTMASLGASKGMARDYAEMMIAKNEGMDTSSPAGNRKNSPTTFHKWAENQLRTGISQ
ncbi:MAG: NAD(P)H-binding protein [Pseudomonadota bacterium]